MVRRVLRPEEREQRDPKPRPRTLTNSLPSFAPTFGLLPRAPRPIGTALLARVGLKAPLNLPILGLVLDLEERHAATIFRIGRSVLFRGPTEIAGAGIQAL